MDQILQRGACMQNFILMILKLALGQDEINSRDQRKPNS